MARMTSDDWRIMDEVLDRKLKPILDEIKDNGSKVHKLDLRTTSLEGGSTHKCDEAIKSHEKGSWSHNPYKAVGAGVSIVGIIEWARSFFHR